jgi:hypothetical protein
VPVVVTWLVLWWFARAEAQGYLLTALAGVVAVLAVGVVVLVANTHAAPARIAAEHAAAAEEERAALARRLLDEETTVAELRALREPKLRLVFDPMSPTYVHRMAEDYEIGHGGYLYRVGVENLSDVPVHNVTLRLVASLPGAHGLPAALRKMHDQSAPAERHFTLNHHAVEPFDVVIVPRSLKQPPSGDPYEHHQMWVCFADPVTPWHPVQTCTLRLEASGSETATPACGALHLTHTPEADPDLAVHFEAEPSPP